MGALKGPSTTKRRRQSKNQKRLQAFSLNAEKTAMMVAL
jgi:hypothetical protein